MTETLLSCHALRAGYGRREVLQGVDLSLAAGDIVGLVGENGCGKSTLLEVLAGSHRASAGTILARTPLAYCPQDVALPPRLTIEETLRLFSRALGEPAAFARARELVDRFSLQHQLSARTETLSGGERQKLSLVAALFSERQVLLLDEPYQALDLPSYTTLWTVLNERRDRGAAILVVGHLLLDRERLARVLTLRDGVLQ